MDRPQSRQHPSMGLERRSAASKNFGKAIHLHKCWLQKRAAQRWCFIEALSLDDYTHFATSLLQPIQKVSGQLPTVRMAVGVEDFRMFPSPSFTSGMKSDWALVEILNLAPSCRELTLGVCNRMQEKIRSKHDTATGFTFAMYTLPPST